jgi:hypothetical protein
MEWWAILTLVVVGPWAFYGLIVLSLGALWLLHNRGEERKEGIIQNVAPRPSLVRFWYPHGLVHLHSH